MDRLKEQLGIDQDKPIPANFNVPFFVHEYEINQMNQSHKRVEKGLMLIIILLFLAFVGTNAYWIYYENQFVDEVTVTQDTPNGNNNYVGRDGKIINGTSKDN